MKTSFLNRKCEKCGEDYDPCLAACPHCKNPNQDFSRKLWPMNSPAPVIKEVLLFAIGCIGFQILGAIIQAVAGNYLDSSTVLYRTIVNYVTYGLLFVILSLFVFDYWKVIGRIFANKKTYLGLAVGVVLILFNIGYTQLLNACGIDSSSNQSTLSEVVNNSAVLGFIILGFFGPICEELTYRAGLFDLLKRAHIAIAYVVTALVFGFIHFNFINPTTAEWLNLPNYIICGAILCFANDRFGIGASMIAHVMNNMFALILMVI